MIISQPRIYGESRDLDATKLSGEYLSVNFFPATERRKARWRNKGLSADFLGEYFSTFFFGDESLIDDIRKEEFVNSAIRYIANELLENAIKFSHDEYQEPVKISLYLTPEEIIFEVINYGDKKEAMQYQAFIEKLEKASIDDLYMENLEKTALGEGDSKMGILTIMNDYDAQMGWQFDGVADRPQVFKITVLAMLSI